MGTYKLSIDELKQEFILFLGELEGDCSLEQLIKALKRAWWHYRYYGKKEEKKCLK